MHIKRTKIVCTLGPASAKPATLEEMIRSGMDVARINFSHGTWDSNGLMIKAVRTAATKVGKTVAVMADLQGPRIRLGVLPEKGIILKKGDSIFLDTSLAESKNNVIPVTYKNLGKDLKVGDCILLDDAKVELITEKIVKNKITAIVKVGGVLTSHKGINLPDSTVSIHALTEKDKKDLTFLVKSGVDYIALSFVKEAQDILDLRYLIKRLMPKKKSKGSKTAEITQPIKIIAKIEKHEAIKNIDEIIETTDGVMVARGDLGIEMAAEEVPLWQKKIIQKCLSGAKPVIVATQMLESMTRNPRPTRAEVSDVANAVIDHTDAVMLSGETANGEYPVEAVQTMSKIIIKTEESLFDDLAENITKTSQRTDEVISEVARVLAEQVHAKAILAASLTGDTGRQISRFRPQLPIYVATDNERTQRQMSLSWGVKSFILVPCRTVEELIERSVVYLKGEKLLKKSDKLIIVAGEPVGQAGHLNLVEVKEVE